MHTKNCIICGKTATIWAGHIHTEIGSVISGWCKEHYNQSNRPRSKLCTSINPHSCGGDYKLSEIELIEELTEENLFIHKEQELFSKTIDEINNVPPVLQQHTVSLQSIYELYRDWCKGTKRNGG